jgi:glutamate dehydrogenase (NAD(P)+)
MRGKRPVTSSNMLQPQIIVCIEEERSKLRAFLVIDSTVRGCAVGGVRMLPDAALEETKALARTMTLKYAFAGLASGGAKASIVGDPEMPAADKHELLVRFFTALRPLLQNRIYIPRPDMGTSNAELERARAAARLEKRRYAQSSGDRSGFYTGCGVVGAALGALEYLQLPRDGYRVAIEGFGKVGSSAARLFADHGARIVAVSTRCGAIYSPKGLEVAELCRLYQIHGSRLVDAYRDADRIDARELLELDVDVLSPCARFRSIDAGNAERVRAKIIAPGANNPTAPEADRILFELGRIALPDFATNTGGMLGETMEFAGLRETEIKDLIMGKFRQKTREVLRSAKAADRPLRAFLEPQLWARSRAIKARAEQRSLRRRLFFMGRALYRCGLVPRVVARRVAPRYLDALLAGRYH